MRYSCIRFLSFCSFMFILTTSATSILAAVAQPATQSKEQEQLAVLRSESSPADKAMACKRLAIVGTGESVADLAKLLPDPQLSSWARIALEAIPGKEADAALLHAAETLNGRLLVGMINSLGVRRSLESVQLLSARLKDSDTQVAAAAAVALGKIGSSDAATTLRSALASAPADVRSAIAEGCILCAERLHTDGQAAAAVEIYDEIRQAELPLQRIVEATRGAILARGQDGIPLLVEQLQSAEKTMFQLALSTAREFPGSQLDQVLAAEMVKAQPVRSALIIQAMADRKDTVVLGAVLKAAGPGETVVRLSAIDALARIGDVSCLSALLDYALESEKELSAAARTTLAELPGDDVDSQIVERLPKSAGGMYPLLLELVGKRRIQAMSELLKALEHNDTVVRSAALTAIGETVKLKQLSVLISQVLSPKHAEDLPVALAALKTASIRMPDREACATQLAVAVDSTPSVPTKSSLLQILGAMGGPRALAAVALAAAGKDPQLQDVSSRLLGEWMTEDAAPVLLELAKLPGNQFQIRALRGYIRIARQFVLPDEQRIEMCRKAMEASRQPAEKKLVLEVLKRYPSVDALKMSINAMATVELKEDATQATLLIGSKLSGKGVDVKELLAQAGFDKMQLEIVKAEFGAGELQKDVTNILKQHLGDLPLIVLPTSSYNATFGGDPAPGSPKTLKIQYRMNGNAGEATFTEDALIILPVPKAASRAAAK